jgi:hypothetical protein
MLGGCCGTDDGGVEFFTDAVDRIPVLQSHGRFDSGACLLVDAGLTGPGGKGVGQCGLVERPLVDPGESFDNGL